MTTTPTIASTLSDPGSLDSGTKNSIYDILRLPGRHLPDDAQSTLAFWRRLSMDYVEPPQSLMNQKRALADRYELLAHIARGGMADVFEANDKMLEPPGSRQDSSRAILWRRHLRSQVPQRGTGRRQPQSPEHCFDLRLGRGHRNVLHRHGTDQGSFSTRCAQIRGSHSSLDELPR